MRITSDDEYRGAGRADPGKTRAERQQELLTLLETPAGKKVIEYHYGKYTGVLAANCPSAGLLMVQTLLNREYPGS